MKINSNPGISNNYQLMNGIKRKEMEKDQSETVTLGNNMTDNAILTGEQLKKIKAGQAERGLMVMSAIGGIIGVGFGIMTGQGVLKTIGGACAFAALAAFSAGVSGSFC